MDALASATAAVGPDNVGTPVGKIPVELSTRFLEHFSGQLYSSPQKAFEELISNGWDAGANLVDIRISPDLGAADATMAVFDNGASMDEAGLRALWHIAFSPKEEEPEKHGRRVIGKFGIGKLATYVLAEKLTYICKAEDGVIRRVTMNYGQIDEQAGGDSDQLIRDLELDVYEVSEGEVQGALETVFGGDAFLQLIAGDIPEYADGQSAVEEDDDLDKDEFGGVPSELNRVDQATWTIVVLSDLKPTGRELRVGHLRRMLAAALPIGSEMLIGLNNEKLRSSKLRAPLVQHWVIGPELDIDHIELEADDVSDEHESEDTTEGGQRDDVGTETPKGERIAIQSGTEPYPYVELPELGRVTGLARLFDEKISGGKSEERGASNGFHVNVLGRVVNQQDPSFGEENLSHAAWARFRLAIRADGLNDCLAINREQFVERRGLKIFRAFLRRVFNKARTSHDSDSNAAMPDGGDVLVQSLGVLSLNPLRSVVSETLRTQSALPDLFDESGIGDREEKRKSWRENTADNIKNALGEVKYERLTDQSFVKFRINDSSVVVNREHPFVVEHSRSRAEKELVRTIAMVSLLSDVYALDIGIDPTMLDNVRDYRDRLMRFRALQQRQSGIHIARLLSETQHDSANSRRMEAAVSDALRHLGFDVSDLAKPGQPEGIARAYPSPTGVVPTKENPTPPLYSFSFDAKSSKHAVAKTGNIPLDAVVEHRRRYRADHALVVAPGFSEGALSVRCKQQHVTPMTAHDLGTLLEYTVEYGAIPVTKLRDVLKIYDPEGVSSWVRALREELQSSRVLTIDVFLQALTELKGKVPDTLAASTIALTCRDKLGVAEVLDQHVIALAQGLQIIVPDLVGINDDRIVVNASATRVAAAVTAQLEKLHREEDRLGSTSDSDVDP